MTHPGSGIRPDVLLCAWWLAWSAAAGFGSGLMLALWLEEWL